jgi:hypothetical protein
VGGRSLNHAVADNAAIWDLDSAVRRLFALHVPVVIIGFVHRLGGLAPLLNRVDALQKASSNLRGSPMIQWTCESIDSESVGVAQRRPQDLNLEVVRKMHRKTGGAVMCVSGEEQEE